MTASFGIDHPLIAVHDIQLFRNRLISIGFAMTAIGKHPWSTRTSLATAFGFRIFVFVIGCLCQLKKQV